MAYTKAHVVQNEQLLASARRQMAGKNYAEARAARVTAMKAVADEFPQVTHRRVRHWVMKAVYQTRK